MLNYSEHSIAGPACPRLARSVPFFSGAAPARAAVLQWDGSAGPPGGAPTPGSFVSNSFWLISSVPRSINVKIRISA